MSLVSAFKPLRCPECGADVSTSKVLCWCCQYPLALGKKGGSHCADGEGPEEAHHESPVHYRVDHADNHACGRADEHLLYGPAVRRPLDGSLRTGFASHGYPGHAKRIAGQTDDIRREGGNFRDLDRLGPQRRYRLAGHRRLFFSCIVAAFAPLFEFIFLPMLGPCAAVSVLIWFFWRRI